MASLKTLLSVLAFITATCSIPSHVSATPDAAVAGSVLSNTTPDVDLFFLSEIVGRYPGQVLNYAWTSTQTGFSETMSGVYGGQALSITYTGVLTAVDPTHMFFNWNSVGNYGAQPLSGIGSSVFELLSPTSFRQTYTETLTAGPNTGHAALVIDATDVNGIIEYVGTLGPVTVNGSLTDPQPAPDFRWNTLTMPYTDPSCPSFHCGVESDIDFRHIVFIQNNAGPAPHGPLDPNIQGFGTIQLVPEPSDLACWALGIFVLAGFSRRSRRALAI